MHPAQIYRPGEPDLLICNTPPEHCVHASTPILTREGWKTVGEITEDDWLFCPDGLSWPVLSAWEPDGEVNLYRVTFGTGDEITTDANHKWIVHRSRTQKPVQMTTLEIMNDLRSQNGQLKWRVRQAQMVEFPERDLSLDPYLLGYWLGDGDKSGARFSVGDEDTDAFLA